MPGFGGAPGSSWEVLQLSVVVSSHSKDDVRKEFDYIGQFERGKLLRFMRNA